MTASVASIPSAPRHVAIILDGNGRWANKRGMPRVVGHKYGAERVREIVRVAGKLGIQYLTLFALSLDNRKRPADEVKALYGLLEEFARSEQAELRSQGARVEVVGDVASLPASCRAAIARLCEATADGRSMVLRLAVAYGAREDVAQATRRIAQRVASGELAAEAVGEDTLREHMWTAGAPNPDLVIRTGGERRLSDFLLLEAAYAELYFTEVAWPDFDAAQLRTAVNDFTGRDRRFGLVKQKVANGANGFEGRAQAGLALHYAPVRLKARHSWGVSVSEAVELQRSMAKELVYDRPLDLKGLRLVAGVDVSVKGDESLAAVVVLSFPALEAVETSLARMPTPFPYVPGLLSFREGPVLERAFRALKSEPDVFLFDGMGRAHPRRIGIACHMGLWLERPTVGCGKTLLVGNYVEPPDVRGAQAPLVHRGETVGAILRTRPKVKPVFISVGHLADLPSSVEFVMRCTGRYRLPEPVRHAHKAAAAAWGAPG